MEDNLVGYLCNSLDEDTQTAVEEYLRSHPDAQRKLDLLRQALAPLAADREDPEPPSDLVHRTLAHIAEHRCRKLPAAPAIAGRVGHHPTRWWRRADVLVAAGLLLAIMGVGIHWLIDARAESQRVACEKNLNLFHQAMSDYSDRHNGWLPSPSDHPPPYNVAGMVVPVLMENMEGKDGPGLNVRCPANGAPMTPPWTVKELQSMDPEEFERVAPLLGGCYAYSLGFQDGTGHRGIRRNGTDHLPVMADRPPKGATSGNSPNHPGGQNVLHVGGHVRFYENRQFPASGDDIYLNQANRIGAGLHPHDIVLGSSESRP